MLAIDTDVVVRYLTADDPRQSAIARRLIDEHEVWVALTVLLETEWVLRSAYQFATPQIATALGSFAGLPTVSLEHPALVALALQWSAEGLDFADALHLAAARHCQAFLTFDAALIRAARRAGAPNVRQPNQTSGC